MPRKNRRYRHILLIRLGALGDVMIAALAARSLARSFPDMKITFLGPARPESVFGYLPSNVSYYAINPTEYGLRELYGLFRKLKALDIDAVCDLNSVWRTLALRIFFSLSGTPCSALRKERLSRWTFLRSGGTKPRKHILQMMIKAFRRLGLETNLPSGPQNLIGKRPHTSGRTARIGIAPFAAHRAKCYPIDRMEEVISALSAKGMEVHLFAAHNEDEQPILKEWQRKYPGVRSMAGRCASLAGEMKDISEMDVMLTMDSANMHLAVLAGTPVISIWGATHPDAGFRGWGMDRDSTIYDPCAKCSPCSIFGERKCLSDDYRCYDNITPALIVERIEREISNGRGHTDPAGDVREN